VSGTVAARADKLWRSLLTPEGVDLGLRLGGAGERAAAFLIDSLLVLAALAVLSIGIFFIILRSGTVGVPGILWLFGYFLLRNFYFALFELGPRAGTPGKRALGLRVVSRAGGRLTADAVLARNLMRELEIFVPLSLLISQASGLDGWVVTAGLVWTGLFTVFPLFNRDLMRAGDLVAGTWVVHVPRRVLLPDLAEEHPGTAPLAFTRVQVEAYGIKELQLLEQVLRLRDPGTMAAVAEQIRRKIGWTGAEPDGPFLDAYYAALRERLERRLLFGHRRADKFDRA
jgi:uncharacterized RDD family membrane protein YckC